MRVMILSLVCLGLSACASVVVRPSEPSPPAEAGADSLSSPPAETGAESLSPPADIGAEPDAAGAVSLSDEVLWAALLSSVNGDNPNQGRVEVVHDDVSSVRSAAQLGERLNWLIDTPVVMQSSLPEAGAAPVEPEGLLPLDEPDVFACNLETLRCWLHQEGGSTEFDFLHEANGWVLSRIVSETP